MQCLFNFGYLLCNADDINRSGLDNTSSRITDVADSVWGLSNNSRPTASTTADSHAMLIPL